MLRIRGFFFYADLAPILRWPVKDMTFFFAKLSHDKLKLLRDNFLIYRAITVHFIAR